MKRNDIIKRLYKNPYEFLIYLSMKRYIDWVPDSVYLRILYKARTGKRLNLKNPKTFNEKLQWLKINDRKSRYSILVDKYEVRKYISEKIGEEYLIPLIGVYDSFDDINFDKLPKKFVIKCTHDSGGLVICRDKNKLDHQIAREKINKSLKRNYYYSGREWPYKNVKPRIIIEQFMEEANKDIAKYGLIDYKFHCFNGEPKFLYVSQGLEDHKTAQMSFYDLNFEKLPFRRADYDQLNREVNIPLNFEKMKEICSKLSKDIDFLRVDLYEINGKIYFSELTFTPCSGMMPFEPMEYDDIVGEMLKLSI